MLTFLAVAKPGRKPKFSSFLCHPTGDDPLSDSECDLDSVAGVLKLYFRGLEPPLFPYDSYPQLLECVRKIPTSQLSIASVSGSSAPLLSCED